MTRIMADAWGSKITKQLDFTSRLQEVTMGVLITDNDWTDMVMLTLCTYEVAPVERFFWHRVLHNIL